MQKKLNEELRTFSRGKDKGIDIRNNDHSIIIQVKHYYKSTFATLISELTKEIEKVEQLKPNQYYYYLFDYYDTVLKDFGTVTNIDFSLKNRNLQEIKKF
mgnify:CR=1 FL=1